MGTRTKNQIVLKKQKCGGFLFKIFEPKMSIRSTNVALAGNYLICATFTRIPNKLTNNALPITNNYAAIQ